MTHVGRNHPCPCGSDKKYKKCCLVHESATAGAYSTGDRHSALTRLERFCGRPEFEPQHDVAEDEFWTLLDRVSEAQIEDPDILEQSDLIYEDWFALDRADDGGVTPVEVLLRREADRLTPGEREYLERLSRAQLRLYEVSRLEADEGLHLVDLWTNDRLFVRERLGTQQIVRGDLLASRLMPGPDGQVVIEGQALLYPPAAKRGILAVLRRADRRVRRQAADVPDALFFKSAVTVLHFFWMMGSDLGAAPVTSSVTPRRHRKGTLAAEQLGFAWAADDGARAEDAQGPRGVTIR